MKVLERLKKWKEDHKAEVKEIKNICLLVMATSIGCYVGEKATKYNIDRGMARLDVDGFQKISLYLRNDDGTFSETNDLKAWRKSVREYYDI